MIVVFNVKHLSSVSLLSLSLSAGSPFGAQALVDSLCSLGWLHICLYLLTAGVTRVSCTQPNYAHSACFNSSICS